MLYDAMLQIVRLELYYLSSWFQTNHEILKQICFERQYLLLVTAKLGWNTNFLVSLWLGLDRVGLAMCL